MTRWSAALLVAALVVVPACGGGGDAGGDAAEAPADAARTPAQYESDLRTVAGTVDETAQQLESQGARLDEAQLTGMTERLQHAVALIEQASPPARATDANARLLWALWASRDAAEDLGLTVADGLDPSREELDRLRDGLADAERALGELEGHGLDVQPAG